MSKVSFFNGSNPPPYTYFLTITKMSNSSLVTVLITDSYISKTELINRLNANQAEGMQTLYKMAGHEQLKAVYYNDTSGKILTSFNINRYGNIFMIVYKSGEEANNNYLTSDELIFS